MRPAPPPFANADDGIDVDASGATIGGTTTGDGQCHLRKHDDGIYIDASCLVEGNEIGTNAAGTARAQTADGIDVGALGRDDRRDRPPAPPTSSPETRTTASDSMRPAWWRATTSARMRPAPPVPNGSGGIDVDASGATIGAAGAGNIIAFNVGPGVATDPGITGSTIRFNSIFSNSGPGIDLNDDGVTPNTPNGANNTPVVTSVSGVIIAGTLNASPDSTYIIDFYANPSSDASAARPQGAPSLAR